MASTEHTPPNTPPDANEQPTAQQREMEPLLGKPGDASQQEGTSIFYNLILGVETRNTTLNDFREY